MNAVDHHLKDGMNESAVRQLAQSDPTANLAHRFGETAELARLNLNHVISNLRELDSLAQALDDLGITVSADLGPIGNAAAAARRDLERDTGKKPFEMPRSVTGRCPSCQARPGDAHGPNCATLTGRTFEMPHG